MTRSAVLLIAFNRPDTTALVMEAVRRARPPRLYVAADGPRDDKPGEAGRCEEARRIATAVDWPCRVQTLLRTEHAGCRAGVSGAIDWFFESEEEGIILEDDCVPSADFFPFCDELLERFRCDERVMSVCGSCFAEPADDRAGSYYFAYYADMWGWATWRRAWARYDRDMERWPSLKEQGGLGAIGPEWRQQYWSKMFDSVASGQVDSWDYQWIYSVIDQHGVACYPVKNLVTNVGFRSDATHTLAADAPEANLATKGLAFPLRHPPHLIRSVGAELKIEEIRLHLHPPTPAPEGLARLVAAAKGAGRRLIGEVWLGALEYYRWPTHGEIWGGAFNGQIGRKAIFQAILEVQRPVAILETGTFRGATAEYFAGTGLPVRTVEGNEKNFGFARARLGRCRNVQVALGDSRARLRQWVADPGAPLKQRPVFAYLDAHWAEDVPLLDELAIVFENCPQAIVVVDDFAVPGDSGYAFDAYGPGKTLAFPYIEPVVSRLGLRTFYPALAAADETGARRGCVVLCRASEHAAALAARPELRPA